MKLTTLLIGAVTTVQAFAKSELFVYLDKTDYPTSDYFETNFQTQVNAGVSHILFAFWMKPDKVTLADTVLYWSRLEDTQRKGALSILKKADVKLIMSVGGETMGDSWHREDPATFAEAVIQDARKYSYDGIDYDLEGGAIPEWVRQVLKIVTETRKRDPSLFLTIAPQPPHFSAAYLKDVSAACKFFDNDAGLPVVDRILMQYYNNPRSTRADTGVYPTLDGILQHSQDEGSVMDIFGECSKIVPKLPKNRLIIGRPGIPGTDNGYESNTVDHRELNCGGQRIGTGGMMIWKYRDSDTSLYKKLVQECSGIQHDDNDKRTPSDDADKIREKEKHEREEEKRRAEDEKKRKQQEDRDNANKQKDLDNEHKHQQDNHQQDNQKNDKKDEKGTDNLSLCKSQVVGKLPEWTANCHDLCQYFSNPAFCGTKSGSEYVTCVLAKSPPGTCQQA